MSRINEKMGLKPARKREMMKLPNTRATAAALTARQCPTCQKRGVRAVTVHGIPKYLCAYCSHVWLA